MDKIEWAKHHGFDEETMNKLTNIIDIFKGKIILIKPLTSHNNMVYYNYEHKEIHK